MFINFYPRSPCGERQRGFQSISKLTQFLSTLSLRRATIQMPSQSQKGSHFYPRSPCGERPMTLHRSTTFRLFLSTLSLRRATSPGIPRGPDHHISIHALLAESDLHRAHIVVFVLISIHALLAESDVAFLDNIMQILGFLSTLSLRRATGLKQDKPIML